MLYERWRQIARDHGDETALVNCSNSQRWTFRQLAAAVDNSPANPSNVAFPQGISPEFVFSVLRAWQARQIVCPLETGQTPPTLAKLPSGCVHLKTTSATTGVPRYISFTGEQLMADAENIVATMGLRPDWPNLGVISLAHSYGFSNLVLPLLLHGVPLFLTDSALPEALRSALTNANAPAFTLPAVPALWRAWHDAQALSPKIRLAISAGAPLPLPLEQALFADLEVKVHNFYGASECGGIAYDATALPRTDAACVGAPLRNVSLSVEEDGCLQVRSRAVGETYWPDSDPSLANGCYRTNDLVELSSGLVFMRGRVSDQINVAGRKVSPESIERVLLTHPLVSECLVFGVPSAEAERTEIIVACVAARSKLPGETLKQFLLSRIPAWQVPREWLFVEALAANQRGKLSRAEWRRNYLKQQSRRISQADASSEIP